MHQKVRELLVAQRTQLLSALRSHLAEIGIIAAQGPNNARALPMLIVEGNDMIPAVVRSALLPVVRRLNELDHEIGQSDQAILALARADDTARRLMTVPASVPLSPLRLPPDCSRRAQTDGLRQHRDHRHRPGGLSRDCSLDGLIWQRAVCTSLSQGAKALQAPG